MNSVYLSYVRSRCGVLTCACLLAVILVGVPLPAEAALVQITQTGNQIDSLTGNSLDADVTGDSTADISISAASASTTPSDPWTADVDINGVLFQTFGGAAAGQGAYFIDTGASGVGSGDPVAGETYFMPITFTDLGFSAVSVDAILEIRVQGHKDLADQSGVFLRRVLFDLDAHGPPTGYSEFVSYPEAQRIVVPEPASGALLISAMGLVFGRRGRRGI